MKTTQGSLLVHLLKFSTALFAMPLLMGAKGGCSAGGDVPVGNDDPQTCGAHDCDGLARTEEARVCSNGSAVGRTVCAEKSDGTCFWDFPACPAPTTDAGPTDCDPHACDGLAADNVARLCPNGPAVGKTVCTKGTNGTCGWDFPPCTVVDAGPTTPIDSGTTCGPHACDGQPVLTDAMICADGSAVGRSVCSPNGAGGCFWDFAACPKPSADAAPAQCGPHACDGLAHTQQLKICPDGTGVGDVCMADSSGRCTWDYAPCPTPTNDGGPSNCACVPNLQWGWDGGLVAYSDSSAITQCSTYTHLRNSRGADPGPASCQEALSSCPTNALGGTDIAAALASPDVVSAFTASGSVYGVDDRLVDGQVYKIQLGSSAIYVGGPCRSPSVTPGSACTSIPTGVQALADLLKKIDEQALLKAPCATTFPAR